MFCDKDVLIILNRPSEYLKVSEDVVHQWIDKNDKINGENPTNSQIIDMFNYSKEEEAGKNCFSLDLNYSHQNTLYHTNFELTN